MICALCREREADKNNTHFLTDGIIRNCLNLEGSKEREKGFYFDLSNDNAFVEFNFQRGTSIDKLEASLGRQVTEKEIKKAKSIPFSVDKVFCGVCENAFTEIESKFIAELLPKFRNADLSATDKINFENVKLVRLFFYLQIWRTSVCDKTLELSPITVQNLRNIILNYKTLDQNEINNFPLSITYLETTDDEREFGNDHEQAYTTNYVGYTNDKNPSLIFMNDFVIQFYENQESLNYFNFYGLNAIENYKEFHNYREKQFVISIFANAKRKKFLTDFINVERVEQTILYYANSFSKLWLKLFGVYPPTQTTKEYLIFLTNKDNFNILQYSKETIIEKTTQFIQSKIE